MKEINNIGVLIARIVAGIIFLVVGIQKFQGLSGTTAYFESLGIPGFFAPVIATLETLGGIALIIGFATRIVGALLTIEMVVAILVAKLSAGFNGYELELMLLATMLSLVFTGAGAYAVDALFTRGRSRNNPAVRKIRAKA